jgi:DNA processing protein
MTSIDRTPAAARAALRGLVDDPALADRGAADRFARVIWSGLTEPGDGVAGRMIAAVGPGAALEVVEAGPRSALAREAATAADIAIDDLVKGMARWAPRFDTGALGAAWEAARRHGIRLVQPGDDDWPAQVDDLGPHAPLVLWVRGDPGVLGRVHPSVAIVGARAATGYGEQIAADIAGDLSTTRIPVISGGAYGIDGAAHRATVTTGGVTVALLAGGAERSYPAGHAHLLGRIAATGAVVSEAPCGTAPTRWRFLQRNRLIAALSAATVVVEAGWRSGSLNTASHAASLGRPLGAVPGPITSAASMGCHQLLREADARCVTSADDVRELIGASRSGRSEDDRTGQPRTDDATRVRDALSTRAWRDTADIARRAGMATADVEALLGFFRLDGDVERSSQGWRRVADRR